MLAFLLLRFQVRWLGWLEVCTEETAAQQDLGGSQIRRKSSLSDQLLLIGMHTVW